MVFPLHKLIPHTFSCHSCNLKIHIPIISSIHELMPNAFSGHSCNHKIQFWMVFLSVNWYQMLFQVTTVIKNLIFVCLIFFMNWYHAPHIWMVSSLHEMLLHAFSCHSCHHRIHTYMNGLFHSWMDTTCVSRT
jgi:uncharacterized protein YlaI